MGDLSLSLAHSNYSSKWTSLWLYVVERKIMMMHVMAALSMFHFKSEHIS